MVSAPGHAFASMIAARSEQKPPFPPPKQDPLPGVLSWMSSVVSTKKVAALACHGLHTNSESTKAAARRFVAAPDLASLGARRSLVAELTGYGEEGGGSLIVGRSRYACEAFDSFKNGNDRQHPLVRTAPGVPGATM
jgi:hypothetical protein